ncbi:MAG TPA: alkaline phosphatase family protein [Terriglobales bacterium]|nr:alkaline phosphatase family protein [Terriglobales bacterium]
MRIAIAKILVTIELLIWALAAAAQSAPAAASSEPAPRRNLILFIADGLRHDAVNADVAPTMFALRRRGVDFVNSHALYPTFTTPNASALATGHGLGDTGDFGNTLYTGHAVSRDASAGTLTPFIENNFFLAKLNDYYDGNYLGEPTLADMARANGYAVAIVGKLGPTAIQDISEVTAINSEFQPTLATIIDDSTGPQGIPLPGDIKAEMKSSGLSAAAPDRSNGQQEPSSRGNNGRPGTLAANFNQQQYLANTVTQAVLPAFRKQLKPFFLVFWSRDPDGTQHNQGDSLDQLYPGINGPTSRTAIRNADNDLWQIVDYLKMNDLEGNTDIIMVADHGFSTISKREISRVGAATKSYAASKTYVDVKEGYLPSGFLAIDLAHALKKPLYDPDAPSFTSETGNFYQRIETENPRFAQHPSFGNGVIGGSGRAPREAEATDAEIIIAANGGSDIIYLPQERIDKAAANKQLAQNICSFLLQQDYVDGIFVRDDLGDFPGTLPLSAVGLMGATKLPKPAIVVNFKSFPLGQNALLTRVEIADSSLQEGQGMHGSLSRADTFNNMAAFGPDFKQEYADRAPASNADIAATIAAVMKWKFPDGNSKLRGRVLSEAIKGGPESIAFDPPATKTSSQAGSNGLRTVLHYQMVGEHAYYDDACLVNTADDKQVECK